MEIFNFFRRKPKTPEIEYELVRVEVQRSDHIYPSTDVASGLAFSLVMERLRNDPASKQRIDIPSLRMALVTDAYLEEQNGKR